MIKSFTVQNFKSILDLTLDFSYSEGKAPNGYEEMETFSGYADDMAISWLCCVLGSGKTGTPVRILAVCPVDGGGLYYEYCKRLQLPGRGSGIQAFLLEYADKAGSYSVPSVPFSAGNPVPGGHGGTGAYLCVALPGRHAFCD